MSNVGYNTRCRVASVKCKQRHKPPVGVSCTRLKATKKGKQTKITGTAIDLGVIDVGRPSAASSDPVNNQIMGLLEATGQSSQKQPSPAEVMEKLNSVIDKFSDIEKRLEQQEKRGNNSLSIFSHPTAHSSPKSKSTHSHTHTMPRHSAPKQFER